MKRGFVLHHNGPAARCLGQPHTRCESFWNAVRSYHINSKGWSDIAYSFGVCPHGRRFDGRGWFRNQFANGSDVVGPYDGDDTQWYSALVFIGIGEAPTRAMVDGVVALIDEGRRTRRCGMRVLPHNAFKVKPCPGPEFTAHARAWDNRALPRPQPEDDMPYTPAQLSKIVKDAVDDRFAAAGTPTRSALVDLLARTIASPSSDLHQAVVAAVKAAQAVPDLDEAAVAAELAPQLLAALSPEAIAASVPADMTVAVIDALQDRTSPADG